MEYRTLYQVFQRQAVHIFAGIETLYERLFKNTAANYNINVVSPKYLIDASVKAILDIAVKQVGKITATISYFTGMEYHAMIIPQFLFQ